MHPGSEGASVWLRNLRTGAGLLLSVLSSYSRPCSWLYLLWIRIDKGSDAGRFIHSSLGETHTRAWSLGTRVRPWSFSGSGRWGSVKNQVPTEGQSWKYVVFFLYSSSPWGRDFQCDSSGCPGTHFIDQAGFELIKIHLLLPPEYWDLKGIPPLPAHAVFLILLGWLG